VAASVSTDVLRWADAILKAQHTLDHMRESLTSLQERIDVSRQLVADSRDILRELTQGGAGHGDG
jgi:hypothetical protein